MQPYKARQHSPGGVLRPWHGIIGIAGELGRACRFHDEVSDDKPENGKESLTTCRQSDSSIVAMKQGNSCGAKGRADALCGIGTLSPHVDVATGKSTEQCRKPIAGGVSDEPYAGNPHVRFCEGIGSVI